METWTISGLVRALSLAYAVSLIPLPTAHRHPASLRIVLGVVGRVNGSLCKLSTSSEATCSEEAEVRF